MFVTLAKGVYKQAKNQNKHGTYWSLRVYYQPNILLLLLLLYCTWVQIEPHKGEAQLGVLGSDPNVAPQREAHASADRWALQARNGWHGQAPQSTQV